MNEKRIELESYNISSAYKRVEIYSNLESYLRNLCDKLVSRRIKPDILLMFTRLVKIFESSFIATPTTKTAAATTINTSKSAGASTKIIWSSKDDKDIKMRNESSNIQMYISVQIGLETVRLWSQLCGSQTQTSDSELYQCICQFEELLNQRG